jgi:hypothetical protein
MAQSISAYFEPESVSGTGWFATALVFVTGVLHVYAGVVEGAPPVALAGVGFFGAIVLFLVNWRRRLLYLVGVVYTGVQIPLWYVAKAGEYTTVGYVDKGVQVVLVVVLVYLYWQTRSSTDERPDSPGTEQAG